MPAKVPHGEVAWLCDGAPGEVVGYIRGYPEHDCPDHGEDDCVCGDDSGRVPMHEAVAIVAWETFYEDGSAGPPYQRCVRLSEEGQEWARL